MGLRKRNLEASSFVKMLSDKPENLPWKDKLNEIAVELDKM